MACPALYDALVVGAGPAGLASAMSLARALQTVAVFDSGVYRNQRATHMHNVPTWDYKPPAEFRNAARAELLSRYKTVDFYDTTLQEIKKTDEGPFRATAVDGQTWLGRTVILATGVKDVMPDIPGFDDCWVKGIFHCLFCHGYEERGASSAGILAIDDIANPFHALHLARAARQLAGKITIYTNGAEEVAGSIGQGLREEEKQYITLDSTPIAKLIKDESGTTVRIQFKDSKQEDKLEGFLVHRPRTALNGPFAKQLGLNLTPQGDLQTQPPFGETNVPGVFAAGDCASPGKVVANALMTGGFAGGGAAAKLHDGTL